MAESGDFTTLPDLASRRLGGSVVVASDETFAGKENLIKPAAPVFDPNTFGDRGKVYDGWETRRRRDLQDAEHRPDFAVVRLGCPGIVRGVQVDTSYFRANYPPRISVEAARAEGYPDPADLPGLEWHRIVQVTEAAGDTVNAYPIQDRRVWTHVRLSIYPDGGVARFRVHGFVVPDPTFLIGTVDLAAAENGGQVVACSDSFYGSPNNLLAPGRAATMADGWENARRRGPGNDFVVVRLGGPGLLRYAEVDTTCFVGNAPGWVALTGATGPDVARDLTARPEWAGRVLLTRSRVQPDTLHRFLIGPEAGLVTHVRLDVYPDGGLSRLRLFGEIEPSAVPEMRRRWQYGA